MAKPDDANEKPTANLFLDALPTQQEGQSDMSSRSGIESIPSMGAIEIYLKDLVKGMPPRIEYIRENVSITHPPLGPMPPINENTSSASRFELPSWLKEGLELDRWKFKAERPGYENIHPVHPLLRGTSIGDHSDDRPSLLTTVLKDPCSRFRETEYIMRRLLQQPSISVCATKGSIIDTQSADYILLKPPPKPYLEVNIPYTDPKYNLGSTRSVEKILRIQVPYSKHTNGGIPVMSVVSDIEPSRIPESGGSTYTINVSIKFEQDKYKTRTINVNTRIVTKEDARDVSNTMTGTEDGHTERILKVVLTTQLVKDFILNGGTAMAYCPLSPPNQATTGTSATIDSLPLKQPNEEKLKKREIKLRKRQENVKKAHDENYIALNHGVNPIIFHIPFAHYYVVKSFNEADIYAGLKYGVWASTGPGNRRLAHGFDTWSRVCPIMLIFSVNGSGHFCGIAQMMSQVDCEINLKIWTEPNWKGKMEVKWIYVKDVPNCALRHIRLSNNGNKCITKSRDTQEVLPESGRLVMEVFNNFQSRTGLLGPCPDA